MPPMDYPLQPALDLDPKIPQKNLRLLPKSPSARVVGRHEYVYFPCLVPTELPQAQAGIRFLP